MSDGAYLWQGFDHEWLRTALGFRLPHRISKLDSYIADEEHRGAAETWTSTAALHVGQAPGVDGNFMRPVGYAAALWAPGLRVVRDVIRVQVTDTIEGDEVPQAETRVDPMIAIDLGDCPGDHVIAVVLRGFALSCRCDPAKQPAELPCNSHGMWPYRLAVELGEARRDGARLEVPSTIEIARGWTPMKGGVPGIEEKPLNRRLDLAVDLHLSVLMAPPTVMRVTAADEVAQEGRARDDAAHLTRQLVTGAPGFRDAVVAMTGFGFELMPPSDKPRHRQRGRYLGALRFRVGRGAYDPATGAAELEHECRLWVPRTVVPTDVRYRSRGLLIQLADGAVVRRGIEARGSVCANSSPEAPFFSRWRKCGRAGTGPEQLEDRVPLSAP